MRYLVMYIFTLIFLVGYTGAVPRYAHARTEYGDMNAVVIRVVDGDTFYVNIPDMPDLVGSNIGVRLAGCDTPELRDPRPEVRALAHKAKQYMDTLLTGRTITLRRVQRGKYFRLIADVEMHNEYLSHHLIRLGYARAYSGGKKSW